ncbi:MAG: hypothetical protein AAF611_13825 [Bacteroidota bacterium]
MKKNQNKLLSLQKRNIANLHNVMAGSSTTIGGPDTNTTTQTISTSITQSTVVCATVSPATTITFTTNTTTGTN